MPKKPSKPQKSLNNHAMDESQLSAPMQAALVGVAALPAKRETKLTALVSLLSRSEGASIEDMIIATGWQKHTIRSALSHTLAKKHGYQIVSEKSDNAVRIYKITGRIQ